MLKKEFEEILRLADNVTFHDGYDTLFSVRLREFVIKHRHQAIREIGLKLNDGEITDEVASELFRQIGRIEDGLSHSVRLHFLGVYIDYPSPRVRDGIVLGLASMDDPMAIPYLESAYKEEKVAELAESILQVLVDLKGIS